MSLIESSTTGKEQSSSSKSTNNTSSSGSGNATAVVTRRTRLLDPIAEEISSSSVDAFQACRLGNLELVKRLVTKANCNEREPSGRRSSCLHFAAGFGRRDVCAYLLDECGADPSVKDEGGLEPIHNASSFGHCDIIELLIERGANVNATDRWQWTPLHESCTRQKLDVAMLLVRRGADVTRKNSDGKSPLDLVCTPEAHTSELRLLLTGEYRKSELLEAAKKGDEKTLIQLLTPLNVNAHASDGRKVISIFFISKI